MKTVVKKLYEGLFLVDSALAASDWDGVNKAITTVLDRAGAEIISQRKWDERKLAYEINRKGRGTYVLCYFKVEGPKIKNIERDILLSEIITRAMILNAEHMSPEDLEKDTPAIAAEKRAEQAEIKQAEAKEAAALEQGAEKQEVAEEQAESVEADADETEDDLSDQDDLEDES